MRDGGAKREGSSLHRISMREKEERKKTDDGKREFLRASHAIV